MRLGADVLQDNDKKNSIEKILSELEHTDSSSYKSRSIDSDVNDILADLGMSSANKSTAKTQGSVMDKNQPTVTNVGSAKSQPSDNENAPGANASLPQLANNGANQQPTSKENAQQLAQKLFEQEQLANAQINSQLPLNNAAGRPQMRAKIVAGAPLSAPVIQNETSTIELPTIKAYSEMQAKRLAEIERAAVESALSRAQSKKNSEFYNLPGMKHRSEVIRVDVDEHFKDFFKNSVANVSDDINFNAGAITTDTSDKKRQKRRKNNVPDKNISVVASSDSTNTANKKGLEITTEPVGKHGTLAGFSLLSQSTDSFGVPLANSTSEQSHTEKNNSVEHKIEKVFEQKSEVARKAPSKIDFNIAKQAPKNINQQPFVAASNIQGEHYTDSIIKQDSPSDTFLQNFVDTKAQDYYDNKQESAGALNNNKFDNNIVENIAKDNNDFWGESKNSGMLFKEITVNMPITRTSTIGVDPDIYGIPSEDYEEHQDYNHVTDAPAVMRKLKNKGIVNILNFVISLGIFLVLFITHLISKSANASGAIFEPTTYLIINTAMLLILFATNIQTIKAGFVGIFGRPSTSTIASLSVIGAIIQAVFLLLFAGTYNYQNISIFSSIVALTMVFNNFGKWLHTQSVCKGFAIASAGEDHSAAFIVPGRDLTKMVCSGLVESDPILLVSRPTSLVRGFLRQSFASHLSDVYGRKVSLILLMAAIVCTAITGVFTQNLAEAASTFAAVLCIGAPLSLTLVYAIPSIILQRTAAKHGAVVPGAGAVQRLELCNTVMLQSKDLFPSTSVKLHGIKPFVGRRIDMAIIFAASIVYYNCPTLRDTFMALIDNKKNVLLPVTNSESFAGFGFSATVDKQQVLLGNRAMMKRHNIELPSLEYENNFTQNGKRSVMYLALNGRPYSIYIISHIPNKAAKKSLSGLIKSGFSVIIKADDFNITSQKVAQTYNVPLSSVKVLSQNEQDLLVQQTDYMPESDGYMTHSGGFDSFIGGLKAATVASRREKLLNNIQISSVLFTMLIALILTITGVLTSLSLTAIIFYQAVWLCVTLIPLLIKSD